MTLPDPREKPTLSVEETAEILSWGRSATYDAVRRDQIPALRIGRRIRIPTAKLRAMLGVDDPGEQPERQAEEPSTGDPVDSLVDLLAEVVARGIARAKERGDL